ncbi:DNA topoisomerase 2-binding protein 1 [Podila humilis]|nr:DNA topoisomerase 2-binding protein 1 [Podila humilis]
MGGTMSPNLTVEVTHLVALESGSPKYNMALKRCIPVLDREWLDELYNKWKSNTTINLAESQINHGMGPLQGCSVCVTGFPSDIRLEIERFTLQFGGTYTMDMIKGTTTHLVCDKPTGKKYSSAKEWNIKCVPFQWLEDVKKSVAYIDPVTYEISPKGYARTSKKRLSDPESDEEEELNVAQTTKSKRGQYLDSCSIYLCESFKPEAATRLRRMIVIGGGLLLKEYLSMDVTHVVVPSDCISSRTLELLGDNANLPYIVNMQWLRESNDEQRALPESDFVVPFPSRTEDGFSKHIQANGSSIWTTDPVVDTRLKPVAIKPNLQDMPYRENPIPQSTTSSPAESVSSTVPIPSPTFIKSPQLLRLRTESGVLTEAFEDLLVSKELPNSDDTRDKVDISNLQEEFQCEEACTQMYTQSKMFLGMHITTFGCKKSTRECIKAETVSHGGYYYEEGTMPAHQQYNSYTIIPLSRPLSTVHHLQGIILTDCWFERSLEESKASSDFDYFLFKPLKCVPIPGFDLLSVSLSSGFLTEIEHDQIARLIKILGGTFHENLNILNTNLLISENPSGAKYEFMTQHGRPIVRLDWLKDCTLQGKLLPYDAYTLIPAPSNCSPKPLPTQKIVSTQYERNGVDQDHSQTQKWQHADKIQEPLIPPLDGCTVVVPLKISANHKELCDIVTELGGRVLTTFRAASATHLVQKVKADKSAIRDSKVAQKAKVKVVGPNWLYKCKETGTKVDEALFPADYVGVSAVAQPQPVSRPNITKPTPSPSTTTRLGNSKSAGNIGVSMRPVPPRRSATSIGPSSSYAYDLPSTQTFKGTAAGATSILFADTTTPSIAASSFSLPMSSMNASFDMTSADQSMQEVSSPMDEGSGVWNPLPVPPRTAIKKRRRNPVADDNPPIEPSIHGAPTEEDGPITPKSIDFFDPLERFSDHSIYWDDADARVKKRALLKRFGVDVEAEEDTATNTIPEQSAPKLYFLLTGLQAQERHRMYETIRNLGGIILELETQDHNEWREKCTHLITNARKPPRTAKLILAQECQAHIVHKGFLIECGDKGRFVDEEPFQAFQE